MTIRLEASARDAQRAPGEVQPLVYDSLFGEFGVWSLEGAIAILRIGFGTPSCLTYIKQKPINTVYLALETET